MRGHGSGDGGILLRQDHILIDIRTSELTLRQLMTEIARLQKEHPEWDIFMDGDAYAIVGRDREEVVA